MVESLEKIALYLARDSLTEQSAEVAEIRSRAGPVLAGAAAAAGLLAKSAFNQSAHVDSRPILQSSAAVIGVARLCSRCNGRSPPPWWPSASRWPASPSRSR